MSIDPKKLAGYANTRGRQFLPLYAAAAEKHGVPLGLLVAQGAQESGYWDPDVVSGKRVSSAGALGVGQFMPATARRFGIDPLDPAQAIDAQAKYMRQNKDLLGGWAEALAGYNWGEGNVQKKGLAHMPAETADYLRKIMPYVGGPVKAGAPVRDTGFDMGRYSPTQGASKPRDTGFDMSRYLPTQGAVDPIEVKARAYSAQYGTPYESALKVFQEEAKVNKAIEADEAKLKEKAKSEAFGLGADEGVMGLVSGVNRAVGSAIDLFTDAPSLQTQVADASDTIHKDSGAMYDAVKFLGQVAPMMAAPVLRAAPGAGALSKAGTYAGNIGLQGASAYTFLPDAERAAGAGTAAGIMAVVPVVGKATQLVGTGLNRAGRGVASAAPELAIVSPEIAAGRQLHQTLGVGGLADIAHAAKAQRNTLPDLLAKLKANVPDAADDYLAAHARSLSRPALAQSTQDGLAALRAMRASELPIAESAGQAVRGVLQPSRNLSAVGLLASGDPIGAAVAYGGGKALGEVVEGGVGLAAAKYIKQAGVDPIALAELMQKGTEVPAFVRALEFLGNSAAGLGAGVGKGGGYVTQLAPRAAVVMAQ